MLFDLLIIFGMLWQDRFFDPVIIKAREITGEKVKNERIVVFSEGGVLPFQIDEVREGEEEKEYFEGDGFFGEDDELSFYARHCGKRLTDFSDLPLSEVFEVELSNGDEKRFCYIGILREGESSLPGLRRIKDTPIRFEERKDGFFVMYGDRVAVFDPEKPVVRKIYFLRDGKRKVVFGGIKTEIFVELLRLFDVKRTEENISSETVFVKGGEVRLIRVLQPYAELALGIKIPTSRVVSYIYHGYTYVENVVPIPFDLGIISKKAYANIYLIFYGAKRFISEKNNIKITGSARAEEDYHMWGYVEGDGWSSAYFIKEISRIPIKRSLYFVDGGDELHVGVNLDLTELPPGKHIFALYGFFFPPGDLEKAKKLVNEPLKITVRKVKATR